MPETAHPVLRIHSPVVGRGEQVFEISGPIVTIGRAQSCDIVLLEQAASRVHAEIRVTDEGFILFDNGSQNGVWVDGQRVTRHQLHDGESFRIGGTTLQLVLHPHRQPTVLGDPTDRSPHGPEEALAPTLAIPTSDATDEPPRGSSPTLTGPGAIAPPPPPAAAAAQAPAAPAPPPPAAAAQAPAPPPPAAPAPPPPAAPAPPPPAAPAPPPPAAAAQAPVPPPPSPSPQAPASPPPPAAASPPPAAAAPSGPSPAAGSAPSFFGFESQPRGSQPYIMGDAPPQSRSASFVWSPSDHQGPSAPSFYGELGDVPADDATSARSSSGLGIGWMIFIALTVMVVTGVATAWLMGVSFDGLRELLP